MALGKISHPEGISALVSALSDSDEEVRQWSAWALGNQANSLPREALISLVQHVADPSDAVREAVVRALSQSEVSEGLLKVLSEAFSISTNATQLTIIQTLAQFEFPFAYPLFIQGLKSPDSLIRQYAIVGLAELGDPRSLQFLGIHLLQDPNVGVRAEAAFRLGKLGGPNERSVLRQARETDSTPNVHLWATWSLAQINDEI